MQVLLALFALLAAHSAVFAQTSDLRSRAVALLERAHAASLAPNLPNLERVVNFRVLDAGARTKEGSFTRVTIQGTGRREDISFGDYRTTRVWAGNTLAFTGTRGIVPP